MKRTLTRLLAVLLCAMMLFQSSENVITFALADPTEKIVLSVPKTLQDGENYFFIREDHTVSENSREKLYIPIQRTGDLSGEADVTLKLVDMTAHYGVNYTAEIHDAAVDPTLDLYGVAVVDLFQNGEYEEIDPKEYNDAIGQAVYEAGGADILTTDGERIGRLSGFPLDEDGNPVIAEEENAETSADSASEQTASAETDASPAQSLRAARDAFTGTTSDRQQLEGAGGLADALSGANPLKDAPLPAAQTPEDTYPGREYTLHFAAGEKAKFLVVTPRYSDAAEGDSIIMLIVKDLPEGFSAPEDFNMRSVIIRDEDPRTPATVSFAGAEITAKDGTAAITVTREGRINSLVTVMLQSTDGSAKAGDDYGGVGAKLYFPMGVTQRTVELPVTHGLTEKDFRVYITPLQDDDGVTIGIGSSRVVIPAADGEAALMAANDYDRLGSPWNLQDMLEERSAAGRVNFQDEGRGVILRTPLDERTSTYIDVYRHRSYAWDGLSVNCKLHTWHSKIQFLIRYWDPGINDWSSLYDHQYGDNSKDNETVEVYYGTAQSPNNFRFEDKCYEVHNPLYDSYTDITIYSVQPIKRKFTVQLQTPNILPFEGLTEQQVLDKYETAVLDDTLETSGVYWTNGHFSVSRLGTEEWARLTKLVAVKDNGATYTLGLSDGSSGSIDVELSEDLLDNLGYLDFITWRKASDGSYSGTIKVKPVFDYVKDVTVEIKDTGYGGVSIPNNPLLLWDFNADRKMDTSMGAGARNSVNWSAEADAAGSGYYTFTAAGDDPYVSVDVPYSDARKLVWAKVRAKNLCGADAIELFGRFNDSGPAGASCVHIDLEKDTQWHTYLINVPEENVRTVNAYKGETITETTWKGRVNWLRLDPIWYENAAASAGDQVQIDYVAFFETEEAAQNYGSGTAADRVLAPGSYTFHYGDKLTFHAVDTAESTAAALTPVGIGYLGRRGGASGTLTEQTDCSYFIRSTDPNKDDSPTYLLTEDYYQFWQVFSDRENAVQVRVPDSDLQYLDTEKGLFAGLSPAKTIGGYTYYTIKPSVVTNEFIELTALTRDSTHIPLWSLPTGSRTYSGSVFWFFAGAKAGDNVVTLQVDRSESEHALYAFDGTAYTSTLNLATGHNAGDIIPVVGAGISVPMGGGSSAPDGSFTTSAVYLKGGAWVRYTVSYNGQIAIREVRLAAADAPTQDAVSYDPNGQASEVQAIPVTLGGVPVESWTPGGARFESVSVSLNGFNCSAISAMEMNGKKLVVNVAVDPGTGYLTTDASGNTVTVPEHILDVTLYFQNKLTGAIHGVYSTNSEDDSTKLAWDAETNTATLTIQEFAPDNPAIYTYGDVLMASLTTDRRTGVNAFAGVDMVYQPASTGFAVIADQEFTPKTLELGYDFADFLAPDGLQDEGRRRSFGQWPWLGEITATIHTFNVLSSAVSGRAAQDIIDSLNIMADEGMMSDGEAELMADSSTWAISAMAAIKETSYGGVRIMVGVAFTTGSESFRKTANPYAAKKTWSDWSSYMTGPVQGAGDADKVLTRDFKNTFGGPYFTFSIYFGLYVDFGYIAIQDTDENGHTEISHDHVLMGAGGFIGGKLTGGYTFVSYMRCPWYFNFEAALDVTAFIGKSADPNKTLEESYTNSDQVFGNDWGFNLELIGRGTFAATIGFGLYKIVGGRATATLGINVGLSNRIRKWYPDLDGPDWISYSTDFTASGTADFIFGSIDLFSVSWPLPLNEGWMGWFQQATRGEKLILLANKGINKGRGSAESRAEARKRVDELGAWMDLYSGNAQELRSRVNSVQDYCKSKGIITKDESNVIDMLRMSGIFGDFANLGYLTDDSESKPLGFRVNDHVRTRWTADDASLMAAFGQVGSQTILENAPQSTGSQIVALGGDRFLVTFLDDDNARDRQQAYTLKYTVYDAAAGTWTAPQILQNDGTADSQAHLTDAGDRIIVTWTSVAQEKYEALKTQIASELEAQYGMPATDALVQDALEQDPARLLGMMDVFTACFDKASRTFGPIEQLTDDDFYDATPQAVYDAETGDYLILYYKTAQDDEAYATAGDKLDNLLSSNPDEHTYSVLCYMLYNNQTDAPDAFGNTHAPGWARDYYFPNETAETPEEQQQSLAAWKGQRFLNSALRAEDGGQTDMPISDLTAAQGYNGLAAFSFTVDKDYDLETTEDRDMFVQFYRFREHSLFVPVKVAGEEEVDVADPLTGQVTGTTTREVSVSDPKLVRSGGSTWLFWRQADEGLRYLNLSGLLNARVPVSVQESSDGEWYYDDNTEMTYALRDDGSFAVDVTTGRPYQPEVERVDFGSAMTDDALHATEYHVVTDKDDNLYVVWTDTDTWQEELEEGIRVNYPTLGIYASAMIREQDRSPNGEEEEEGAFVAAWSKPYLLTRDTSYNDGLSIALKEDGSLIVVHNQLRMLLADTEEEQAMMVEKGLAGIQEGEDGKLYFIGSPFYPSEISLNVTSFAPIGSVEATGFRFSDDTPVAGQTVAVTAVIENTGLTAAEGCSISVYEYKDGQRGKEIYSVENSDRFPVNNAKKIVFDWTVPGDGPDGYRLVAVSREEKADGSFYDPVENFSPIFTVRPDYELAVDSAVQNGDGFDMKYHVANTGNQAVPAGFTATLDLEGLYGDLGERYGMDDPILITEDISGLAPGEVRTVERTVELPVSVFAFCGYDAVSAAVRDESGAAVDATEQTFITLDAPIHLALNGGDRMNLTVGEQKQAELSCESTVFMDANGAVLYTVSDPGIACVGADGTVTALGIGETDLTATLLPSGRSVSIRIKVARDWETSDENPFVDVRKDAYYYAPVLWAAANGITNGVDGSHFAPDGNATRAQVVTFLWRAAGCPEPTGGSNPFADVNANAYYYKAVLWAAEKGITRGTGKTTFSPEQTCTRGQVVTFLHRFENTPAPGSQVNPFADVKAEAYYYDAVLWAVNHSPQITNGTSATTFSPNATCTRGQIVTFLYRSMK